MYLYKMLVLVYNVSHMWENCNKMFVEFIFLGQHTLWCKLGVYYNFYIFLIYTNFNIIKGKKKRELFVKRRCGT